MNKIFDKIKQSFKDANIKHQITNLLMMINGATLLIHIFIFIISVYFGITPLAIYNIFSVCTLLFCIFIIKRNYISGYYYILAAEMIIHSFIVALTLSDSMGFFLYFIILIPASFICFFLSGKEHAIRYGVINSVIIFIFYIIVNTMIHKLGDFRMDPLSENAAITIYLFNSLFVFLLLTVLFAAISGFVFLYLQNIDSFTTALGKQANTDALTGLNNRRGLDEVMESKINLANNTNINFSILMCDIDHFKDVNDTYGHDNGDIVLKEIADILRNTTRPGDYLCRWGGEEFIIVLQNADKKGAVLVAQRIKAMVAMHEFKLSNATITKTITIGVCSYKPGMTMQDMYSLADQRMYEGKQSGRNKIVYE